MPQMKLFGNSRSAARVAGKRKPDSEQAPKEKKQKKESKETKKEEAAEGACHLADRDSMSGRLVLLLLLHEQCLRRKMAHDLHPDCDVYHAPPVAGDLFYPQGCH